MKIQDLIQSQPYGSIKHRTNEKYLRFLLEYFEVQKLRPFKETDFNQFCERKKLSRSLLWCLTQVKLLKQVEPNVFKFTKKPTYPIVNRAADVKREYSRTFINNLKNQAAVNTIKKSQQPTSLFDITEETAINYLTNRGYQVLKLQISHAKVN